MRMSVVAAVVCLSIGLSGAAEVEAAARKQTNIPAQGLGPALQALAKERNFQLIYVSEEINDVRTPGAVGELTSQEALQQLLNGTGLTFRYLDEETVTIVPVSANPLPARGRGGGGEASPPAGEEKKSFWKSLRLAQAQTPSSAEGVTEETAERSFQDPEKRIELEEIIVTGTNIRGVYPSSSPVEIYTAEDIARTGATTTEQFIQKLPQNLGTRTQNAPGAQTITNREAVNGIDLRGLGVGTTLTLLNGRRLGLASNGQTVDVSLIPVSAIDRVEVLTDGASAIYGSDAIGGVVNFVLRDDFEGAETRLGYGGVIDGDMRQSNATQTFGHRWDSGHGLVSYDFFSASPLDSADRDYAVPGGPAYLTPDDRRNSALLTISQNLGERLRLDGDLVFARRDTEVFVTDITNANPLGHFNLTAAGETQQYFANLGATYRVRDSLNGALAASYSHLDVDTVQTTNSFNQGLFSTSQHDTHYTGLDVTATLDGTLFALPAGSMRFSTGVGYLNEEYKAARSQILQRAPIGDTGRATSYAFGELFAPLVGEEQGVPLVRRLELNLAARYTSYDDTSNPPLNRDFGDSVDPKVGLLWTPLRGLNLRATYGTSFRAPSLTQLNPAEAVNTLSQTARIAGVPAVSLLLFGPPASLDPETAETRAFGFDYRPTVRPGFQVGVTYFSIDYDDRIGQANVQAGAANPAAAPDAVYRATSAAQIEEFLRLTANSSNNTTISLADPHAASLELFALPNFWIRDNRFRNLAVSRLEGFDLAIRDEFGFGWGNANVGAQLTRVLDYEQQDSPSAPVLSIIDTVTRPVSFRGRVYAGLTRGGLQTTLSVNYVDDYANLLAGGAQKVDSWTTVDWNLSFDFGAERSGVLDGVSLSVSAQNLLDEDPPFVARNTLAGLILPAGFDPANASPVGRFIVVSLSKRW